MQTTLLLHGGVRERKLTVPNATSIRNDVVAIRCFSMGLEVKIASRHKSLRDLFG